VCCTTEKFQMLRDGVVNVIQHASSVSHLGRPRLVYHAIDVVRSTRQSQR
jgi:hypothetical protein